MEKRQQQHWDQPRPPMPTRSKPSRRSKSTPVSVARLMQTRPLLILGGAWALAMVVALVAIGGLLSPNLSNGHQPAGATIHARVAEAAQNSKRQSGIPFWLFGAIALSCAAGSVLISRQATRPPRPRKSAKLKRLQPHSKESFALVPRPQPATDYVPLPAPQPQTGSNPLPAPLASSTTVVQSVHPRSQRLVQRSPDVPVTVVPSEESHPLDWGNASLADTLDLRKQRSLSSWL